VPSRLFVTLNARLRPLDRGQRYEDHVEKVLESRFPGSSVAGGGTLLGVDREPEWCDFDLDIEGDAEAATELVIAALEAAGAPKGSHARLDDGPPVPFGSAEGVAIYLNGTDLPDEVYETSDINELVAALREALGSEGDMQSYWEGSRETALYLYGPSAIRIRELVSDVLARFPLAQSCRVVTLASVIPA
jgi:hypothetical protein